MGRYDPAFVHDPSKTGILCGVCAKMQYDVEELQREQLAALLEADRIIQAHNARGEGIAASLDLGGAIAIPLPAPDAWWPRILRILFPNKDENTSPQGSLQKLKARANSGVVPIGGIILWGKPIKDIPPGWDVCDGTRGTPNLLGVYPKGVATATTDPGTTGGNLTHDHSTHATHTAGQSGAMAGSDFIAITTPITVTHAAHSTENHEPPFRTVAFIMRTA